MDNEFLDEQFIGFVDNIVKREVCYNNIYMAESIIKNLKITLELTCKEDFDIEVVKTLLKEDITLLDGLKEKSLAIVQVAENKYSEFVKILNKETL